MENSFSEMARENEGAVAEGAIRDRRYTLTVKQAKYLNWMMHKLGLNHMQEPNQWWSLRGDGVMILDTPVQEVFAHYKKLLGE